MFVLPLWLLVSTVLGLFFIGVAIAWRAAKFIILVAGTTYMLTTVIIQSARANVPAQIEDPIPAWTDPYAIFKEDYAHRSHPFLDRLTFFELTVITDEKFIDYPHVFLSLDACLDAGIASRHFEENYKGFVCEKEEPHPLGPVR